jgi:hypothetical protein
VPEATQHHGKQGHWALQSMPPQRAALTKHRADPAERRTNGEGKPRVRALTQRTHGPQMCLPELCKHDHVR